VEELYADILEIDVVTGQLKLEGEVEVSEGECFDSQTEHRVESAEHRGVDAVLQEAVAVRQFQAAERVKLFRDHRKLIAVFENGIESCFFIGLLYNSLSVLGFCIRLVHAVDGANGVFDGVVDCRIRIHDLLEFQEFLLDLVAVLFED